MPKAVLLLSSVICIPLSQVSVVVLDVLNMLIAKNAVVVCKFNPVQDYLGAYVECAQFTSTDSLSKTQEF